jgi:poly(3-hydroxybutyrate) depolymerase
MEPCGWTARLPLIAAGDSTDPSPGRPLVRASPYRRAATAKPAFERTYGKPPFNLPTTLVDGDRRVTEKVVWQRPFCDLIHFRRDLPPSATPDPKVLIVAPMSGHYATLLRGTVETLLPHHEVYITDWADARMVPLAEGRFDLDDYVDYVIDMLHHLGEGHPCDRRLPALGAGAGRVAHGGARRPFVPPP